MFERTLKTAEMAINYLITL